MSDSVTYRASWIVPVSSPPIRNGYVTVRNKAIERIGAHPPDNTGAVDLGEIALIPGLINAHTHLEFSDLESPIGSSGMEFPEWIRAVISHRLSASNSAQQKLDAIRGGLTESKSCGVVAIGEIATDPILESAYENAGLDLTLFVEVLGRDPEQVGPKLDFLVQSLDSIASSQTGRGAVSPHAPYSVHRDLLRGAIATADSRRLTVAMHLAESVPELQLLASGDGGFADLFRQLGVWHSDDNHLGGRPLDHLVELARLKQNCLIVHGNYLTLDELDFIADSGGHMSVVYCPRTHAFFKHAAYPLSEMLERKINVAVGTDSRASNPDLCVMSELRTIRKCFPRLSPREILAMGTLNGARALGIEEGFGSLESGRNAEMNVCELPEASIVEGVEAAILDEPTSLTPLSSYISK
ncbi:MAG: amidohydrolase family protein [Planctomycetota bacterium]